jgi:EmrB/QacA subfamily drug resistance transporter
MSASPHRRLQRGTLAVTCLATAMLMLDIAVVNTALPYLARDVHAGLTGVQWVVDAYTLALAAVVLSAGSVADRRGRRLVFVSGMVLFTVASLACGLAHSIGLLDASRAVQGFGASLLFASSLAILADAFPDARERAGAMAVYGATIGASFAIGPALGGALTTWLGWRSVFFINVPLGVITVVGAIAWVRESRNPRARQLDWPGQITLSGGLFLLVLALIRGGADGWGSARTILEFSAAVVLLASFVLIERRVSIPMLPLGMFRRRDFTAAQSAAFAISASFFSLFLYTTLYLQNVLHLSALDAGLVYLPGTVLLFVVSGASAKLTERFAPWTLVFTGLVLVAVGLALMAIIGAHSSWTVMLPGTLVVCVGTGLFNPALALIALSAGPIEDSGLLAGVNDAFRQSGIAVGVAVIGVIVPAGAALGHGAAAAYVRGLHHALFAGAGLALTGAAVTVALLGIRRRPGALVPAEAV